MKNFKLQKLKFFSIINNNINGKNNLILFL